MKKYFISILLVLGVSAVQASEFNYTFADVAYREVSIDAGIDDIDGDGYSLSGSYGVTDNLAITVSYTDLSYDFSIDSKEFSLGVDFHTPIGESTDLVLGLDYLDAEVSVSFFGFNVTEDDTGNAISAGIRHKLSDIIEIEGGISRADIFDDTETSYGIGLLVGVSENIAIGVGYGKADDVDSITVGVRFQ